VFIHRFLKLHITYMYTLTHTCTHIHTLTHTPLSLPADDFIDVIVGNRVYLKCIYVSSKYFPINFSPYPKQ
jgi:ribosome-interacting GTPase 1